MKTNLTLLLIIFILGACSRKEDSGPDPNGKNEESTKVVVSFINEYSPLGRAFGDAVATSAEKKVNTAKLFIFQAGNKIFEKSMTTAEVTNIGTSAVTFIVPAMLANTSYNYYIIINKGDLAATSLANLSSLQESDITTYNGAWNTINDAASASNRPGGFVMTGNATVPTGPDPTSTQTVNITAARVTAKLDITTTIDATIFGTGNKYPGTLVIDSTKISRTQATTPLIPGTPTTTTGAQALAKQISNTVTPNSTYQNRFYVFENGIIAANSRVLLTIHGTYTNGGVISPVIYSTELSSDGSIIRNGAYAINITIKGLTGTPVSVIVTLKDWETLNTQVVNLGS